MIYSKQLHNNSWPLNLQTLLAIWGRIQLLLRVSIAKLQRRRVPLVLQMGATECGAACLTMILGYHGRDTSLTECREQLDAGRDGSTALDIAQAARHYGLHAKAYTAELEGLAHVALPAIIHWNFSHFVVLERWSPRGADIVDPAGGRRSISVEEFDQSFTGVVLTFAPTIAFERKRMATKSTWRTYLMQMIRTSGTPSVMLQLLGVSALLQLLGLALPLFTKVLIDTILPLANPDVMTALGIGMVVLVLAQLVTSYLRATLLIYLQGRLDAQMMVGFFAHTLSLPYRFFQQRTSGDLLARLNSNMVLRETFTTQMLSTVLDGTLVIAYLTLLLWQAPTFGILVFVIGLLQVLLLVATTKQVQDLTQRDLAAQSDSQGYLVEALTGIATLKVSGAEDRALRHWSNLYTKYLNISLRRSRLSAVVDTFLGGLQTLAPLALLWLGIIWVMNGTLSLGSMLALNAIAITFLAPLASLVTNGQQLQMVGAHLQRIADVIEEAPEQDTDIVRPTPQLSGHIALDRVSFQYDRNSAPVLREISVDIRPGQKVALVGRTGSGKSTLAKLLLGLYQPTTGTVRYDNFPLAQLNYQEVRRQFGVVMQDLFLFSGTIRQNIAMHDNNVSLERILTAAELACIDRDVIGMPMAFETLLAEGGDGLSGGQRQRLAVARALVNKPAVLLLDEATSHLDAVTEKQVADNISSLKCTQIVIAHRLSTIQDADLILVLDEGQIVEQGTHETLLAAEGMYSALVRGQSH